MQHLSRCIHSVYRAMVSFTHDPVMRSPMTPTGVASPQTQCLATGSCTFSCARKGIGSPMSAILIVDDDPHLRELASVFLRREGFDIYEASDGVEALSILDRTRVELVILDIMMPKMDGWELGRQLRTWYERPILMLTAKGETSHKLKGF